MEKVLLHVEELPGNKMNLQLQGDPARLAKLVANAMQFNQEVAAAIMAPVIEYCEQEGIDCGQLSKAVKYKS